MPREITILQNIDAHYTSLVMFCIGFTALLKVKKIVLSGDKAVIILHLDA